MKKFMFSFVLTAVCAGAASLRADAAEAKGIVCEGEYGGHLQGVATDGTAIYWSFTETLVRTDLTGKRLAAFDVPSHHGDLCVKAGVVYVAVNLGTFNQEAAGESFVFSYDAKTLRPRRRWRLDMPHGAGGMTWKDDHFFVVGGLPATHERNYVYEYDEAFRLVRRHELETGYTWMGIQTAAYENGRFYFGFYGTSGCPNGVLACPADLGSFTRYTGRGDVGIITLGGKFLLATTGRNARTGLCGGGLDWAPDFPSKPYRPEATGKGRLVIFYEGLGTNGWCDAGYELQPDGYMPLFAPVRKGKGIRPDLHVKCAKAAGLARLPAVGIGGTRSYAPADMVRGLRRAAVEDEVLAVHVPGTPETTIDDPKLQITLDALAAEAKRLGVKVENGQ